MIQNDVAGGSCIGCERLDGVLEEDIPTWQERIELLTGCEIAMVYGGDDLGEEPPEYVKLRDGTNLNIGIVRFIWQQANQDFKEREQTLKAEMADCPGYDKRLHRCGKVTLGYATFE